MRESTFIGRNKTKWEEIEEFQKLNPDEAASDFVEVISDLSYAQTHYPHSKITSYLNFLALNTYKTVYKNKKLKPFLDFWITDFPLIIGKNKKVLWLATAFFLTFCTMGVVCSYLEPGFVESVLGSRYIDMTHENIAKGKPFGVYADSNPLMMFLRIFSNNLFVGLLVFISGFFLGIGSFYHTFKNGVMVGTFFSIFFKAKIGFTAIIVVGLHGTLELMALVLECMAGLLLGLSYVFPGTNTRKVAFRQGLQASAKIFMGTVPFTFVAALVESYITRLGSGGVLTGNILITALLILVFLGSWAILVWYFFIYSSRVARGVSDTEYRINL